MSDKIDLDTKTFKRDKENNSVTIIGSIQRCEVTLVNVNVPIAGVASFFFFFF